MCKMVINVISGRRTGIWYIFIKRCIRWWYNKGWTGKWGIRRWTKIRRCNRSWPVAAASEYRCSDSTRGCARVCVCIYRTGEFTGGYRGGMPLWLLLSLVICWVVIRKKICMGTLVLRRLMSQYIKMSWSILWWFMGHEAGSLGDVKEIVCFPMEMS